MTDRNHAADDQPEMNGPETERHQLTADEIRARLAEFTGSTSYYRHWTGLLVYTDGAKAMADICGG